MIRLEHLNLVVIDLEQSLDFYRAAFPHWRIRDAGDQDWYGTQRSWVHFGDDFQYLTLNDSGLGENRDLASNNVGLSHIGFVVNNVDALAKRLAKIGYEPDLVGAEHAFRKNLYYIDPNGFEVEFVQYLSDLPRERNS